MRTLTKQGVGVTESKVGEFFWDLADTYRSTKYRTVRKTNLIMFAMRDKLQVFLLY